MRSTLTASFRCFRERQGRRRLRLAAKRGTTGIFSLRGRIFRNFLALQLTNRRLEFEVSLFIPAQGEMGPHRGASRLWFKVITRFKKPPRFSTCPSTNSRPWLSATRSAPSRIAGPFASAFKTSRRCSGRSSATATPNSSLANRSPPSRPKTAAPSRAPRPPAPARRAPRRRPPGKPPTCSTSNSTTRSSWATRSPNPAAPRRARVPAPRPRPRLPSRAATAT